MPPFGFQDNYGIVGVLNVEIEVPSTFALRSGPLIWMGFGAFQGIGGANMLDGWRYKPPAAFSPKNSRHSRHSGHS